MRIVDKLNFEQEFMDKRFENIEREKCRKQIVFASYTMSISRRGTNDHPSLNIFIYGLISKMKFKLCHQSQNMPLTS
jgi:hypothetical protein